MKHALDGLRHTTLAHSNFFIHLIISFIAVVLGFLLSISRTEWLIIILVISVGLMMELVNTAIESVVDLVTLEWRQSAKIAKDTSAAAMLVYSVGAALIGLLIFIPRIMSLATSPRFIY
jgi:diacylglycerol kinase